jgi:hypothetical protein
LVLRPLSAAVALESRAMLSKWREWRANVRPVTTPDEVKEAAAAFGPKLAEHLADRDVDHLRQIFEYHKHTDWMFHQRLTMAITLNAGLWALFLRAKDSAPFGIALIVLGAVATWGMYIWTERLVVRIKILSPFLDKDPVYDLYARAFPRRALWAHWTVAICSALGWGLALLLWIAEQNWLWQRTASGLSSNC